MMCKRIPGIAAIVLACGITSAVQAQVYDPLEPVNRVIFNVNDTLDRVIVRPVAQGYVNVVPRLVRTGVSNVFGNISDAFSAINNLLQGKREALGNDMGRVLVNTTFGLGGIFDIASEGNIEKHDEDFGQTLGYWGVGPGPYLVLPILGPSNIRDTAGLVVQGYLDPVNQVTPPENQWELIVLRALDTRARLLGTEDLVAGAALDKYTFIRSAYTQRRRSQVYDGKPP
ncbi:MAG: VacJ family lipoprotein, partial [Betaproteobacteria bacterium]